MPKKLFSNPFVSARINELQLSKIKTIKMILIQVTFIGKQTEDEKLKKFSKILNLLKNRSKKFWVFFQMKVRPVAALKQVWTSCFLQETIFNLTSGW